MATPIWRTKMPTLNNAYDNSLVSNAFGFLRQPLFFEPYTSDADAIITGVTFDMATSGRSGSRFGPAAIRQVSTQLAWEGCRYPWKFDVREKLKIADCGDLVYSFGDSEDMCQKLTDHIYALLQNGKYPVTFGGDHFITLPILRAFARHYGTISMIHFDAHADTYSNGSKCDHGTMFYHAPKEGLIDPQSSVQVGIRTEFDENDGFLVLDGARCNDMTVDMLHDAIKERVGNNKVYLTFDIDCLDPAYAPGTGTPVTGGLSTDKILKLLRSFSDIDIVGFDVVEVAPNYDISEITSLAAATIALDLLYLKASKL